MQDFDLPAPSETHCESQERDERDMIDTLAEEFTLFGSYKSTLTSQFDCTQPPAIRSSCTSGLSSFMAYRDNHDGPPACFEFFHRLPPELRTMILHAACSPPEPDWHWNECSPAKALCKYTKSLRDALPMIKTLLRLVSDLKADFSIALHSILDEIDGHMCDIAGQCDVFYRRFCTTTTDDGDVVSGQKIEPRATIRELFAGDLKDFHADALKQGLFVVAGASDDRRRGLLARLRVLFSIVKHNADTNVIKGSQPPGFEVMHYFQMLPDDTSLLEDHPNCEETGRPWTYFNFHHQPDPTVPAHQWQTDFIGKNFDEEIFIG